jgi:diaminohydroxyphosphoribosylaminopyrimidine deaminase / 5-amino-6-(5-phosphoribosylamino)uracil reductase
MGSPDWGTLMRRAVALAELGRYGASPNPLVGALVVARDGEVVGEGAHRRFGGPHAEVEALLAAGERARGGTVVVTLEPCAHHGKTPPCVDAIVAAGVATVVAGTRDPNPSVDGAGVAALRARGIAVFEGVEEAACRDLIRRFLHWKRTGVPWVTLKMGMTIDGKLATPGGRAQAISGAAARRAGYALREELDAVLVGIGTVLADNPRLGRHLGLNPNPHVRRVVLDSRLRTPPQAALLATDPGGAVVCCVPGADAARREALVRAGATVVEVTADETGGCDPAAVLRWLSSQGVGSVLVEGGGEVHFSFLRAGVAQELVAFIAPLVLGGRSAVPAVGGAGFPSPEGGVRLRFRRVERAGEDVMVAAEILGV